MKLVFSEAKKCSIIYINIMNSKKQSKIKERIYLDFASQTMPSKKVLTEMKKVQPFNYNPANIYKEGVDAENILTDARIKTAKVLGVRSHEIYFTNSGTLSCASAIFGVLDYYKSKFRNSKDKKEYILPHIITSNIEHAAVLQNIKYLEKVGEIEATYIECDEFGIVNPEKVKEAIKENTILISIMYANNEVGTIQDIKNISKKIKEYKRERKEKTKNNFFFVNPASKTRKNNSKFFQKYMIENNYPYFHTDAAQAGNYLSLYIDMLGVDLLSLNGSKIYGPKSSGILFKKENINISPLYFGGAQERGLFSGTVDIEKAVGIAVSIEEAQRPLRRITASSPKDGSRLNSEISIKRNNLANNILKNIPEATINGYWNENEWRTEKIGISRDSREAKRLPNNISIWLPDFPSDEMVLRLDKRGYAVSAGSACSAKSDEYSHVIYNLYKNKLKKSDAEKIARETIRITIDKFTEEKDLERFVKDLKEIYYKFKLKK